ncbi:mercuric transport protein periplasmic component [Roseateles aquatilis]|jgi:periplasmic mercuric ion binding protein|uniref:Periplasmic mercury ion-binding protein n=2 Tax=Pseudomonadota TaxID=1224 RepID=A0A246JF62_9BURK|nr:MULTISPECIES: mercury resistance system periplasmic binding protein MerP [Pseudomonadota]OWQ91161.1 mercuric transport protein periplasmic component [Roseateles aquatilis]TDK27261.1 mercury resistance system periplasmic binding protein MerP [Luteimonas aestuarii]
MVKSLFIALGLAAVLACCQCSAVHAATRTVTLDVSGMTCVTCPITVKKSLSRVVGVESVDVSFKDKQATVVFDDAKTTVEDMTRATANAGFPSTVRQ